MCVYVRNKVLQMLENTTKLKLTIGALHNSIAKRKF